jgi:hypothetical protein
VEENALLYWTVSLVGMQLREKYEEKFDISSEGPSRREVAFARNVEFLLVFFRSLHPYQWECCFYCTGQVYPKDFLLTFNTVSSFWKTLVFCFEQVNFIASSDAKHNRNSMYYHRGIIYELNILVSKQKMFLFHLIDFQLINRSLSISRGSSRRNSKGQNMIVKYVYHRLHCF